MGFLLCASCQRHVKNTDGDCPFCGASTAGAEIAGNPRTNVRDRNKLLFGAAIAVVAGAASAIGCSSSTTTPVEEDSGVHDSGTSNIDGSTVALYGGAPVEDAGTGKDSGGVTPAYGGAPVYGAPASNDGGV